MDLLSEAVGERAGRGPRPTCRRLETCAGALVYAFRRPDPYPAVFGFHEVFHVLVIAAVACQYSAVAFFVLPDH